MNRCDHYVWLLLIIGSLGRVSSVTPCVAAPPNILMISIDDLNANVGYLHGDLRSQTPSLDAIAAHSARYMDAHATAPVCVASRTSLLWGVQPSTTGITTGWLPAVQQYREFRNTTALKNIVQLLAENGYHTMGAGKVFHEHNPDDWHESLEQPHLPDPILNHGALDPSVTHPDRKIADWAIEKLSTSYEKPFLLAVGFHLPHLPMLAPQAFIDDHRLAGVTLQPVEPNDLDDLGPIAIQHAMQPLLLGIPYYDAVSAEDLRSQTRSYKACVSHTDHQIMRLIEHLTYSIHRKSVVIVIWSDHGYHLGAKRHIGKATLWSESTQVPLLIHAPDFIPPGPVNQPVSLLDVAPTIAEIAGVPRPAHFEGESLVGYTGERSILVTTFYEDSVTTIDAETRVTEHSDADGVVTEVERYNRIEDPYERNNLATGD